MYKLELRLLGSPLLEIALGSELHDLEDDVDEYQAWPQQIGFYGLGSSSEGEDSDADVGWDEFEEWAELDGSDS